jgi:hypothetical protein
LATFSLVDVAILRTMGFPAVLASGLEEVRGKHLDFLCRYLRIGRRGTQAIKFDHARSSQLSAGKHSLRFVGWSIADMKLFDPSALEPIQRHFNNLRKYVGVGCDSFSIWRPTAENLERVRFSIRVGDKTDVCHALAESMDSDRVPIIDQSPFEFDDSDRMGAMM